MTLDPDVVQMLREETRRQRKPFKQVVNEALRAGLGPGGRRQRARRYRVTAHKTSLQPGIDAGSLNRLADELEDEAVARKMRAAR